MLQNKEVKKFIITEVILFVFVLLVMAAFNTILFVQYKNTLIENNSYVMAAIVEKHPELESEVINHLIKGDTDVEKGYQILEKYGLTDVDSLNYIQRMQSLRDKIHVYNFTFTIFLFGSLSAIYFFFMKKQHQKIEEINKYMVNLLNGDYSMDIRDYDEGTMSNLKNDIYRITVLLKNQSERDKKAKKDLEDVLSDISHQLKTPLTSMYVISDLLMDDKLEDSMRKEFVHKNRVQLERIEWLVTSLLKISRLDSGTIVLKEETVNVQKLIEKAKEPIAIAVELKKQKIKIEGDPTVCMKADFHWTVEALLNILKNAHEHSGEGSTIEVHYTDNSLYTEINVKDYGEGMDEKDKRNVFKRFYKGNSNKESIGIGLNMAFMIVHKENGDITVQSEKGKGTTFSIRIYKKVV